MHLPFRATVMKDSSAAARPYRCPDLPSAPVDAVRAELAGALEHGNAVLSAPPGAGKSSRVPLWLLEAPWLEGRKILLLEPRRVAARALARYAARLLGEDVGPLQLSDVTQVAAYLKRMPEYSSRWDALDENTLHRGQIEKLLKKSIFQNFSRIYHFANPEQRKFLDLYSKRYEIRVLKEVMTNIFDHRDTDPVDVSPYREFFRLHSNIDVDRITTCSTMEELISCLKGNEFYIPLSKIQEHETALLFDYGMALDLYYFTQIWNIRKKLFKGKDLEEITCTYGEKFDMLNLQFIQRSKRYYNMDPASIYALLIPVNYKLKKEEITALVEAPSYEEGRRIFQKTWYGNKYEQLTVANLEEFYNHIHRSILEKESHRNPYSVAVIYSYLYNKEHEVNRLTIAIECVRYGVQHDEAMRYICNS